jgi:pantetheine-phosphate adenylyltransferase
MKAVFAGTFDPPTSGHLDIISRAAPIFAELRVVVAHNLQKQPLFSLEERMDMLERLVAEEGFANIVIDSWDGLIAEYARKNTCGILLRSIRNMAEIPYEQVMATMNARLEKGLETMFMFSMPGLSDVSSSAVRELVVWKRLPPGIVPDLVQKELEKRYGPLLQD